MIPGTGETINAHNQTKRMGTGEAIDKLRGYIGLLKFNIDTQF